MQRLDDTHPIARKVHWCDGCNREILPGEKYERQVNLGYDGLFVWKCCAHCSALFGRVLTTDTYAADMAQDEGLDLAEYMPEWETITIADARVKLQHRRKWRDRNGQLYPVPSWPAAAAVSGKHRNQDGKTHQGPPGNCRECAYEDGAYL